MSYALCTNAAVFKTAGGENIPRTLVLQEVHFQRLLSISSICLLKPYAVLLCAQVWMGRMGATQAAAAGSA